ncbi:unnamed protein product [marine sediment metagenome]|uniref:Uncharacterized protein n=1 Tax=marine sediment metagenome TaxID=412755 RepID=X1GYA4_9ZZZZ
MPLMVCLLIPYLSWAIIKFNYKKLINGIKPQGKSWTQNSDASIRELSTSFSSAEAEREGGLNNKVVLFVKITVIILILIIWTSQAYNALVVHKDRYIGTAKSISK